MAVWFRKQWIGQMSHKFKNSYDVQFFASTFNAALAKRDDIKIHTKLLALVGGTYADKTGVKRIKTSKGFEKVWIHKKTMRPTSYSQVSAADCLRSEVFQKYCLRTPLKGLKDSSIRAMF